MNVKLNLYLSYELKILKFARQLNFCSTNFILTTFKLT